MSERVIVVTGANRGIGLEVARQAAADGDTVILTARDSAKAEQAAAALSGDVSPHQLDVTDAGSAAALATDIAERHGRVDVLINNAGILYDTWQRASDADLDVVREALETNLLGTWQVTLALLDLLRASHAGRIVNVSSGAATLEGMTGGTPAYKVSKTGISALTRMLADELAADGILVNAVCPGWVATDMGGSGGRPVEEGAASVMWAADLPAAGPTGGFFRDGQPLAW